MQAEADWHNKASSGGGAGRKARRNPTRQLAVGFLVAATIITAAMAWASAPAPSSMLSAPAPAAVTSAGKLYGQLDQKVANSSPDTRLRVIVHLKEQADLSTWPANDRPGAIRKLQGVAARTQPGVISAMEAAASINVYQRFWIFNGFAVEAPVSSLRELAQRADVDYILEDGYMQAPKFEPVVEAESPAANWNIYQVRAPEVWALGYDGAGRVLANIDSGVQGDHDALEARWRGVGSGTPANSWFDPYNLSPTFPSDPDGHGTHTMGTIAGYQGDSTGQNEIGQSKGAEWIACRNYDASGKGPFTYIHACFEWIADPDGNPNTNDQPDTVNNSWGDANAYQYPDLEWWGDIEALRAVNVIPVFSNGNSGPSGYTVGYPGGYPTTIGVGAISQPRNIAGFSSRGPSINLPPINNSDYWDRSNWSLIKPDIVAPGVAIRSSLPGNTYGNNQGTSMAAPHVAGMVGLLRQIRPDLTVNEFHNIIKETAFFSPTWGTLPNNNFGWGEIDDYAAAIYVRDAGAIMGTVMDDSCDVEVVGAEMWVYKPCIDANANGECGIRKMISDNNGDYRTILAAGTYTVTVSAPGFYGQTLNTTVMSTTTQTVPIMLAKMPTGTVMGTVTDGTNPVISATVSIDGLPDIWTTTNGSGQYTLNNVPAGNFTIRADLCGYTPAMANVAVTYPGTIVQNLTMPSATTLFADDFEDGDLNGWTVTGGFTNTAIWHNSDLRPFPSSLRSLRAGRTDPPYFYQGNANTFISPTVAFNTAAADRVWLSFNLYDDAESEYDVFRVTISTDGGATWPEFGANNATVFGQASPVHGWQNVCLDITRFQAAQMKFRFRFSPDGSNWNGENFEGPSVDNVRLSMANNPSTPLPAQTPTPGTPIPCEPVITATPTMPVPTATATATPPTGCTVEFEDVPSGHTFYSFIHCLACQAIINGYPCGGDGEPCVPPTNNPYFRPGNNITRGQLTKIVAISANYTDPVSGQTFEDVQPGTAFYTYTEQLAGDGVMGGYPCGQLDEEPCVPPDNRPYFRPGNNATRGQLTKIVALAAGFTDPAPATFTFTDVPVGHTFHIYVEALLTNRPGAISGYACGVEPTEPCDDQNRNYFRPNNTLTRGQASKIVTNTFFPACEVR